MATSGGGAEYVATVQGIIFGPTLAYGMQLKAWGAAIDDKLDKLYPKGSKAQPSAEDVAALAQVIADAIQAGDITPAPVFKTYRGTDDLTTSVQQNTDDKGSITAGVTVSVVNISGSYDHGQTTTSSNQQNHHLEYEVDVPLPTVDVMERAAGAVRNWLLLRGYLAVPGTPDTTTAPKP